MYTTEIEEILAEGEHAIKLAKIHESINAKSYKKVHQYTNSNLPLFQNILDPQLSDIFKPNVH